MSGEYGTIENIGDNELVTDAEIMDLHAASKEKSKAREKELDRQKIEEDFDYVGAFRYSHFICHPRCGFTCDRRDEGLIQEHKESSGWQIEIRQQKQAEERARLDGIQMMGGALHEISEAEYQIKTLETQILEEEKKNYNANFDLIKHLQHQLSWARSDLLKGQKYRHSILNHQNEITRQAAKQFYDEHLLKMEKKKNNKNKK